MAGIKPAVRLFLMTSMEVHWLWRRAIEELMQMDKETYLKGRDEYMSKSSNYVRGVIMRMFSENED